MKRKREVLGEAGVNDQACMRAEVIPKFERESDQREYVDGDGKDAEGIEFLAADSRGVFARGIHDYAEADEQAGIGAESLVVQKLPCRLTENHTHHHPARQHNKPPT